MCIYTCVYTCNFSRLSSSVSVPWAFWSLGQHLVLSDALSVFVAMTGAAKLMVGAGASVRTAPMPTSLFQHIQFSLALTAPKKAWGLWTSIQKCRETPHQHQWVSFQEREGLAHYVCYIGHVKERTSSCGTERHQKFWAWSFSGQTPTCLHTGADNLKADWSAPVHLYDIIVFAAKREM